MSDTAAIVERIRPCGVCGHRVDAAAWPAGNGTRYTLTCSGCQSTAVWDLPEQDLAGVIRSYNAEMGTAGLVAQRIGMPARCLPLVTDAVALALAMAWDAGQDGGLIDPATAPAAHDVAAQRPDAARIVVAWLSAQLALAAGHA
jgi:hypothetical protein